MSNIFLDILFVAVFKMGVVGAAVATDISQLISCIFILRFLRRSKEIYGIRFKDIRFYPGLLSRIIKLVREAQSSKAPIARLAEDVSLVFVPTVMRWRSSPVPGGCSWGMCRFRKPSVFL